MPKEYHFNDLINPQGPRCYGAYPDPVAILEPAERDTQAALFAQMAELLTPVFHFMAAGADGGTLDMRAWVVLYVVRPDAIHNESQYTYAKRRGVSQARVKALVSEFRRMIPDFRSSTERVRRPSLAGLSALPSPTPR